MTTGILKLGCALLTALTFMVVGIVRRVFARARLAEYDAGKRCIACDSLEVKISGDAVSCERCLHTASLAALRREQLTEAELKAATSADSNTSLR